MVDGDSIWVLLARGTPGQIEIEMQIMGLFERLPGFSEMAVSSLVNQLRSTELCTMSKDCIYE